MKTREQVYADAVYKKIQAFINEHGGPEATKDQKKKHKIYGSMAHKLPVLIRTAGLAQAIAFVSARGKNDQKLVLTHLEEVLRMTNTLAPDQKIVARSREASIEEYMRLTDESLAALLWFKRYAQSVLKVEATDEPEEDEDAAAAT